MKKLLTLPFLLLFTTVLLVGHPADAEAKRFGGGSSFGGKSSYGSSFQRKAAPTAPQQQGSAQGGAGAAAGGFMRGGLGGMLGGLLMGGLLGSLLFGGAFDGINFMDILLLAGVAFAIYWFMRRGRRPPAAAGVASPFGLAGGGDSTDGLHGRAMGREGSATSFDTDRMFKGGDKGAPSTDNRQDATFDEPVAASVLTIPKGFDSEQFLQGAKSAFHMMQQAWDEGDLGTIREFSTDKVFAEIQDQLRASHTAHKTEVIKLTAELLEVREVGDQREASVMFDAMMRENDSDTGRAEQVREVWHFIQSIRSGESSWYLDGLQQLES